MIENILLILAFGIVAGTVCFISYQIFLFVILIYINILIHVIKREIKEKGLNVPAA